MPLRTITGYLQRWGMTPQKPIKRAYEKDDKKVSKWLKEEYPNIKKRAQKENAEILEFPPKCGHEVKPLVI